MSTLKERLFTNWHLMRIMRLGLGVMMIVMGIQNKDWAVGLFSVFFLYQAVTDTGCCGSGACYTPPRHGKKDVAPVVNDGAIEFEEVK